MNLWAFPKNFLMTLGQVYLAFLWSTLRLLAKLHHHGLIKAALSFGPKKPIREVSNRSVPNGHHQRTDSRGVKPCAVAKR
jgi:hypothetical protein